jgi:hypothetical protein
MEAGIIGFCYERRLAPGGAVGDGVGHRFLCGTRPIPWLMLTQHLPLNDQPRSRKMIHQGECGSGFDKIYDVDLNPSSTGYQGKNLHQSFAEIGP